MTLSLVLILVFSGLAAATLWWASLRMRRLELERMPVLVGEMMSRLGLTPRDAETAGLEDAVRAAGRHCPGCVVQDDCREWLAAELLPHPAPRCPNAPLFEEIRSLRKPVPPRAAPRNLGVY